IVTSLSLAGPNCLDVLAELGQRIRLPPIIALASSSDASMYAEAQRLGVAFIFEKPINPSDIRDALFSLEGGNFAELSGAHQRRMGALQRGNHWLSELYGSVR